MIKAKRLAHATFETPDLERDIAYHEQVIGLSLVGRENGRAFLATEAGQLAVVLESGAEQRCTKLAFEIAPHLSAGDVIEGLSAEGLRGAVRGDPAPGLRQSVAFSDPKGTELELFSSWDFLGNGGPVRGVGPVKLGHLAFIVPDPQALADFYARVLGFRVADWIEDWFVFMRCNMDHHAVNFVRGPRERMHHIAFELRDSSHLHRACDLLGKDRIPILWGPVRHGPGHNLAVYHRNPADHLVEFFIDLDEMVDEELGSYGPRPWHWNHPQKRKIWTGQPRDISALSPLPEDRRDTA